MRKYVLLALLAAAGFTSCKPKPEPGPTPTPEPKVAFTLNGEIFNNYRVLINDNTSQEVAAFEPSTGYLHPIMKGGTVDGKYQVEINPEWKVDNGNVPKTITFNDINSMEISITDHDTVGLTLTSKLNQGTVTINKFGNVGQTIEGTFKGTFTSSGGGDISVTDGKFIVKRDPDL